MFRFYYRWKYHRARRSGSYRMVHADRARFGPGFSSYMGQTSFSRGTTSGRFDSHRRRRRKVKRILLVVLVVGGIGWVVYESIRALSLFQ